MRDRWTDERFDKIDERFDRLEVKLDRGFEAIDRRFQLVDQRFDSLMNSMMHGWIIFAAAMISGFVALAVAAL